MIFVHAIGVIWQKVNFATAAVAVMFRRQPDDIPQCRFIIIKVRNDWDAEDYVGALFWQPDVMLN